MLEAKYETKATHFFQSEQFLTNSLRYILTPHNKISVLQNVQYTELSGFQPSLTTVSQRREGIFLIALMNQRRFSDVQEPSYHLEQKFSKANDPGISKSYTLSFA